MAIRFDDIGNRLKAFRLASGLTADEIAERLGISRAALYRFEKGELAKIETLEKLSELLGVSVPTLLGVGVEYIPSAVAYFERLRQIEETAEHIVVLAGPISYVLTSGGFDARLAEALAESAPLDRSDRERALGEVAAIMAILAERKRTFQRRRPSVVNLISAPEIERFIRDGLVGRADLAPEVRRARARQACAEVLHLAQLLDDPYDAIRFGAARSLRTLPGFDSFAFDFVAPPQVRRQAQLRTMATWDRTRQKPGRAAAALLQTAAGDVDIPRILALLKQRNNKPMLLRE